MSELDFDELDKAVNTLMGDVPKVELSKHDDTKTLNISSTLPGTNRPSLDELNSALSQVNGAVIPATPVTPPEVASPSAPVSASTTPLAARRGGRFMDVVHPSSDMKGLVRPASVPSRQGVTIVPSERLLTAESDDQSGAEKLPVIESTGIDASIDTSSKQDEPGGDWPDPLEMSGYNAEPDTSTTVAARDSEPAVAVAPVTADVASEDSDTPVVDDEPTVEDTPSMTSPFIADAKVDKRPLGGASNDDQRDELGRAPVLGALATNAMASTSASDQLPANPADIEPQLPPELQSDLMAIETDGGDTPIAGVDESEKERAAPIPAETPVAKAPIVPVTSEAKPAAIVSGPTSITQQYHEEPSTSDQTNGSIYDMASYHQPLAHPVKKKSGWLWILWILLLLIVGGGGAAALYFFDII
jgi:hypothetical protein